MSNIRVTYAEIEQAAAQLGLGRDDLTARLQTMQQQIRDLVSSGFVTDLASTRFEAAFSEYSAGANVVIARLDDMQTFLMQTATAMRDLDAQIAARIG